MPIKELDPLPKTASGYSKAMQIQQNKFSDYQSLVDKQYENDRSTLGQQYLTDEQYQGKLSALQSQYKNMWAEYEAQHDQGINEIKRIQSMAAKGEIDPALGERAAFQMVLPPEEFAARYPERVQSTPTRPISAPSLASASGLMSEFITGAEDKRGFEWGDPHKSKEGMVKQYISWRSQAGYDYMDPMHQRQLDQRWDALMRSDKRFKDWFSNKKKSVVNPEARTLRMKTRMGRAMQKKLGVSRNVSPIGKSIIGESHKEAAPANVPTAEELRQGGGEKNYQRGIELGYWK